MAMCAVRTCKLSRGLQRVLTPVATAGPDMAAGSTDRRAPGQAMAISNHSLFLLIAVVTGFSLAAVVGAGTARGSPRSGPSAWS
jgi:hypothetical protein